MTAALFDPVARTLSDLGAMSMSLDDQIHHVMTRACETGGMVKLPQPGNSWDSQRLEISLHNVWADGASWAEAIRNWQRAARVQVAGRAG